MTVEAPPRPSPSDEAEALIEEARRRARRRRLGYAAALVVAALLGGGLYLEFDGNGGGGSASTGERSPHGGHSQTAPQKGQYVYTKSREAYLQISPFRKTTWSVLVPETRQIWIGPDGSGRLRQTRGRPRFLSAKDRALWRAAGSPKLGGGRTTDQVFRGKGSPPPGTPVVAGSPQDYLSYLDLTGLPTDPDALRELIEERKVEGGPPGDAETFTIIGDLLRETYAPPKLRAALYQVAAELPGVELLGTVRDEAGRKGIGVGYTDGGERHELIFDRKTSVLLGERDVL